MGINLFGSSSSYDSCKPPNPDPYNFRIKADYEMGDWLVLLVTYPDCNNYEGSKVLVFEGVTKKQLEKRGKIDPHFSENEKKYSPIARFVPTPDGWAMACLFVQTLWTKG